MKRVFVDANVLLELLLVRAKVAAVSQLFAEQEALVFVSPLSVHLCYHYCQKENITAARLTDFFQDFRILDMDDYVVKLAQKRYKGKDFEDCLQAACAELGGCDEIITLDKQFVKYSGTKLPVTVLG